jgi:hypothetical protein
MSSQLIAYQTIQSFQIYINSGQATTFNNTKLSDVTFDFKNIFSLDKKVYEVRLGVVTAEIPYSFYQINETNYKFQITIGGITSIYNASLGNYNINTFITRLLSILPAGFNITYDLSISKLTFSYTQSFQISDTNKSIFPILGFATGQVYTSNASFILTAPNCYNLNPINRLMINTNTFNIPNIDTFNKSITTVLASIPINCMPNDTIFYTNFANFRTTLSNPSSLNQLNLEIYDDYEQQINFNGLNWTLTIQVDVLRENLFNPKNLEDLYTQEESLV